MIKRAPGLPSRGLRLAKSAIGLPKPVMRSSAWPAHRRTPHGLTLVESVICISVVGVMLVAALNAVGAARLTETRGLQRQRAHLIAQDLLNEIAALPYEDAEDASGFGSTAAERSGGTRAKFDDINDYANWTASPPTRRDGTVIPDTTGWSESVTVNYLDPNSLSLSIATAPAATRVTVTVSVNGAPQAELTSVFTRGLPQCEACCLPDGSCIDLPSADCLAAGGKSGGAGTQCLSHFCDFGLVARWKMDDGAGGSIADAAGGNTGLLMGPSFTTGKMNGGLSFDGVDDYVYVTNASALSLKAEATITAWVNKRTNTGWDEILCKGSSGNNRNYSLRMNGAEIVWSVYDGSLYDVSSGVVITTNRWYHLAVSYSDDLNQVKFYVDGSLRATKSCAGSMNVNSDPLMIGRAGANPFDGLLDDLRIYNRVLTNAEVGGIMHEAPP